MNRELVCSILGISVDAWPPSHYALIGLSPQDAQPHRVEIRVQELSARLRSYQLAHPDEVTDALNRLAQALVCLTDPAARAQYDSAFLAEHERLVYDVVPSLPKPPPPQLPVIAAESVEDAKRASRRSVYRRLASVRQLRTAWRALEPWFGDSAARVTTLVDAADMIRAAWVLRDSLSSIAAVRQGEGALVAAFVREPHILRLYRRRTPLQRSELALDWRRGLAAIELELRVLRGQVQRRRALPRRIVAAGRWLLGDGLDFTLFLLGALAIGIAIWRSQH